MIANYFKTSRKAPDRYLPGQTDNEEKETITAQLNKIVPDIQQLLKQFTEEELDTLVIPHPLLGNLTIREMFYLMSYHATHHFRQIEINLESYRGAAV